MKIAAIEAIPYSIPYRHPLHFASGSVHEADHVLVRLRTDDGVVGLADTPPRPYTYGETQKSIAAVVQDVFAPQLIGVDIFDREKIQEILYRTIHNQTAKGAVDIALWDVIGKTLGQPVTKLLGGYTDSLRVSHMLGFKPAQELLDLALEFRETYGINTFKLKTGRRPLHLDIEAARALREGLGGDAELYMDANRGWSANEAAEVLRRTADLGLQFLEEPDDAREVLGRRRLVANSPIPIAADESAPNLGEAAREILNGGANLLAVKTARSGFTEAAKIVGMAEGMGIDVYIGNQIDTQVGTVASVVFGAAFAHTAKRAAELSNYLDMADDLLAEPLQIIEGRIRVPEGPGVGAGVNEEKLERYRSDR
ncbi:MULTISPECIES: mandelate racemase/muconate lactonizing enzyme family protein [Pseudarthrobacter]|uniref:mandelate racemase/muconate lactonizing enzyme family protein n=1 Tax=Pseudarthrobacter TaxID=1742993 RepID=UPI0012F83AB4|nr:MULTISPECIES: enolase C-terminal domain-like protein [Pseudarthrobacter]MEA3550932.1 enolase C-terminal domain-like protein [Pseudarthrobacter sp. C1]MUU73777.1 enolase [Pseudarthrobacter sp. GA104]WPU11186.1 enolase C-terminal domain-like protein [Pseudarthrobacter oxydans]